MGCAGPSRLYLNATDGNAFGPLPALGLCCYPTRNLG